MEIASLASALSTYGLWAVVAVLLFAVAHLYREQGKMHKEMRDQLANQAKEMAKMLAESTQAIQNSTDVMNEIKIILKERRSGCL